MLAGAGVRVPPPARDEPFVGDGGLAVTAWERLARRSAPDWRSVGRWSPRCTPSTATLPAGTRAAGESFPWWQFDELLAEVADDARRRSPAGWRGRSTATRGGPAARRVVCHGDVHPGNVVMTAGRPVLLDWDLLCLAPPAGTTPCCCGCRGGDGRRAGTTSSPPATARSMADEIR